MSETTFRNAYMWCVSGDGALVAGIEGGTELVVSGPGFGSSGGDCFGGPYDWSVTTYEPIVVGPYPGSPDTRETVHGAGCADTVTDAQWAAIRCWERAWIAEDTFNWEVLEHYAQDPDYPDRDWWKA